MRNKITFNKKFNLSFDHLHKRTLNSSMRIKHNTSADAVEADAASPPYWLSKL